MLSLKVTPTHAWEGVFTRIAYQILVTSELGFFSETTMQLSWVAALTVAQVERITVAQVCCLYGPIFMHDSLQPFSRD